MGPVDPDPDSDPDPQHCLKDTGKMRVTKTGKWRIVSHRFAFVQKSLKDKNVFWDFNPVFFGIRGCKVYVLCSRADRLKVEQAESYTHTIITSSIQDTLLKI